jgi:hypothetical protein
MTRKEQAAAERSEIVEPRLADVVGDRRIPGIKGHMHRELIELPDGTFLWLRVSRRQSDL